MQAFQTMSHHQALHVVQPIRAHQAQEAMHHLQGIQFKTASIALHLMHPEPCTPFHQALHVVQPNLILNLIQGTKLLLCPTAALPRRLRRPIEMRGSIDWSTVSKMSCTKTETTT